MFRDISPPPPQKKNKKQNKTVFRWVHNLTKCNVMLFNHLAYASKVLILICWWISHDINQHFLENHKSSGAENEVGASDRKQKWSAKVFITKAKKGPTCRTCIQSLWYRHTVYPLRGQIVGKLLWVIWRRLHVKFR